jgi:hypothetical protein
MQSISLVVSFILSDWHNRYITLFVNIIHLAHPARADLGVMADVQEESNGLGIVNSHQRIWPGTSRDQTQGYDSRRAASSPHQYRSRQHAKSLSHCREILDSPHTDTWVLKFSSDSSIRLSRKNSPPGITPGVEAVKNVAEDRPVVMSGTSPGRKRKQLTYSGSLSPVINSKDGIVSSPSLLSVEEITNPAESVVRISPRFLARLLAQGGD